MWQAGLFTKEEGHDWDWCVALLPKNTN